MEFSPAESAIGPIGGPPLNMNAVVEPLEEIKLISKDPLAVALQASFLLSIVKLGCAKAMDANRKNEIALRTE
jgi:hypothetical protein